MSPHGGENEKKLFDLSCFVSGIAGNSHNKPCPVVVDFELIFLFQLILQLFILRLLVVVYQFIIFFIQFVVQ